MDGRKKTRTPLRTALTKAIHSAEREISKDEPCSTTLETKLNTINDLEQRLATVDQEIVELLYAAPNNDAEYNKEVEEIEDIKEKIRAAQLSINKKLIALGAKEDYVIAPTSPNSSFGTAPSVSSSVSGRKKTYKLPKVEIRKFSGEVLDWLPWWNQFERIHEDEELHESDKFQYLSQSMVEKSKAAELIRVYPQTAANYPKVIEALKSRFGVSKILKRVYVRELLKMINKNSRELTKISSVYDKLEAHLKALESLGVTPDQMDVILFPMVESCLPEEVIIAWQRSINCGREDIEANPPKTEFDFLMEFIKKEVENENQREMARSGFGQIQKRENSDRPHLHRKGVATASSLSNTSEVRCAFCDKNNHLPNDCLKAKKMTIEAKREILKTRNCCFKCLKFGHVARKCKVKIVCGLCKESHASIMCTREVETSPNQHNSQGTMLNTNSNHIRIGSIVLLKTLHVKVRGSNGKTKQVKLLFDDGSERSFIKKSTAKYLKCNHVQNLLLANNLFGGTSTGTKPHKVYNVMLAGVDLSNWAEFTLIDEDVICGPCPTVPNGPWIEELSKFNIQVTDTGSGRSEVEILIGSDRWGHCMTGRMKKLSNGLLAMETIFGWTLTGEIPDGMQQSTALSIISMSIMSERSIQDLWSLEAIGIRDRAEKISKEEHDEEVKENLHQTITREDDGRYVVKLPWINRGTCLPTNRKVAESRLMRASDKLNRQDQFKRYDQIFQDWETEGIIQVHANSDDNGHFLPHRPVFKPSSLTTPVRPVFDASCKIGKHPSLNQCLEKGPNYLELIPSILLRFRQKNIGVVADIRKAFQMIGVAEDDRNFQKFLWWEDDSQTKMKVYRHSRVVFGMNCSPFLLAAVLNFHLDRVPAQDKRIADQLKKSLYVDNVVTSVENLKELNDFKDKSIAMLADAKMDLRCWESNKELSREMNQTNVLGLKWQKDDDTLSCQVPELIEESIVTKRKVLSTVAKVFDPIGFSCPATLQPKILLQESWATSMDWDKEWEETPSLKFQKWVKELEALKNLRIPRQFGNSLGLLQIHTFVDASKDAYAAVVFSRVEVSGSINVNLLLAKSRLAPLDKKRSKSMTIPRLELMGCLIGARLTQNVKDSLDLTEEVPTHYWTDSTVALAWIKRDEDWGSFVGNRVREVNRLSRPSQWRYVPGKLNPADLPSRGCSPMELLESRWWEGPTWLKESEESWPKQSFTVNEDDVNREIKKTVITSTVISKPGPRFSRYLSNVRVAAWIRRFIANCRRKKEQRCQDNMLSVLELVQGEADIIKEIQMRNFPANLKLKSLQIFTDVDNLFHVNSRLSHREDTDLFRSPILLPREDSLVHQLIMYVHESHGHAGTQFVLGKLREKYWILQGRRTVSRVIHKCVVCRRHGGKKVTCPPADLPRNRIQSQYAFQTTGVDLAGPLIMKGGKKTWVVIYTCAVYRAVYLDTVTSISTEDFINSLEKFTLIVGRPNTIYSDNGTNFVGAENLFKKVDQKKIQVDKINWIFNPPTAAWWGGWWERLVRSLKELLRRMIGTAKLTHKELDKCLASITYTINNRPLTTLTEDPDDLTPLTPAMFLRDLPVAGLPEGEEINVNSLRESYQKVKALRRSLNNRFRKEYLSQLVQKKNETKKMELRVGDVVLVGADNRKRFEWPLGRIVELYPGKDKQVRVAKVKTGSGFLIRPVQRLYPLEVTEPEVVHVPEPNQINSTKLEDDNNDPDDEEAVHKTRYGRRVRAPVRYTAWNK